METNDFSAAQMASRLDAIRNTGGTAEERAWARELSGILHKEPGMSLPDAEHQAWVRVIRNRFEKTGGFQNESDN